jgi:hypothetical protein
MLVIRLNHIERTVIDRLAESEKLPVSTFARQLLLKEADRRGFFMSLKSPEPTDGGRLTDGLPK